MEKRDFKFDKRADRVLDVGCGTGTILKHSVSSRT